jgi:hypothetical protein
VYERVSGQTIPVTEPLRLADLFRQGDERRVAAERAAAGAALLAHRLAFRLPTHMPELVQLSLG